MDIFFEQKHIYQSINLVFGKCANLGLWIQILNQKWVNTNYSEGLA